MISILKRNKWLIVKTIVLFTIIIPAAIISYEIIINKKDTVVFSANFPTAVGVIIAVYYVLLLIAGIIWVLIQLNS